MTYEEYYNQWQLSTESRDLAFDEWLCLILDRQKAIDDKRYEEYLAYMVNQMSLSLATQRKYIIEKACEAFCKSRNCGIPLSTCLSLGTCEEYDAFNKEISKALED